MVWDYSRGHAKPVAVPFSMDTSAQTERLDALIGMLALRAKQEMQLGPSTTLGQ